MPGFRTDGERLWHAITRRPTSRRLRLVYADWLEENGDQRAEFIRLQLRAVTADPWREGELLRAYEAEWLGPLLPHARDWHFAGGLLEWVSVEAPVFLAHADEWLRRPGLLGVHLTGLAGHVAGLAECPALRRLPYLFLGDNGLTNHDIRLLAGSRHLRGVRHLHLQNNRLGNEAFPALMSSPSLAGLLQLNLDKNALGPGLAVPHDLPLHRLRAVSLSYNPIDGDGLAALVNAPALASLRAVRAGFIRMPAGALARLVATPGFARLRSLSLSGGELLAADLEALAASPNSRGLRDLRLEYQWHHGEDRGIEALVASPHLRRLRRLSLAEAVQGPVGHAAFGRPDALPGLRDLQLSQSYTGHQQDGQNALPGIREMLAGPLVRRLRRLVIGKTRIPGNVLMGLAGVGALPLRSLAFRVGEGAEEALSTLVGSGRLDRLRSLSLNGINAPGFVGALCRAGRLPHFRSLETNQFGADLEALAGAMLPSLASLRLDYCDDDEAAARALLGWAGLRRLKRLVLWDRYGRLEGLFDGDTMPALEELFCVGMTPALVARLPDWPGLGRLRRLTVPGYGLSPAGAQRLAAAPFSPLARVVVLRAASQAEAVFAPFLARLGPRAAEARVAPRTTRLT